MNKELTTFDDVVKFATWEIMTGLLAGKPLRESVFRMLDFAIRWSKERENKN